MGIATRRAAEGSGAATHDPSFEAFYRRDRDGLHRALAFALGDPRLAGEAVDEAMARAFERWSRIGGYEDPAGWVYRVALNRGRSVWRRTRRLVPGRVPDRGLRDPERPDPALWAAVAALPEAQRDAIVLRFVLDWPHDRIAVALDIATSTARSRVTRGLQRLREELEATP